VFDCELFRRLLLADSHTPAIVPMTVTWLVIGYVLAAIILLTAFAYHIPYATKLKAAAEASPDDQASNELRALVEAPSGRWVNAFGGVVWLALIYVMVAKPFS
jgi:hypothetical protein